VVDEGLFSDHRMFSLDLIMPVSGSSQTHEMVPDLAKADFDKIRANLAAIDWEKELDGESGIVSWEYVKDVIDREDVSVVCLRKGEGQDLDPCG
jgi:hypothetical protein